MRSRTAIPRSTLSIHSPRQRRWLPRYSSQRGWQGCRWMGRRCTTASKACLRSLMYFRKLHCELLPRVLLVLLIQDSGSSCSVVSLTIVHELTLEPFETDLSLTMNFLPSVARGPLYYTPPGTARCHRGPPSIYIKVCMAATRPLRGQVGPRR